MKEVFGTSNEKLLGPKHVRSHELKKDLSVDWKIKELKDLFDYITPLSVPLINEPTTNYLMPNYDEEVCALLGIINSLEEVPYNNMNMFAEIIAKIKHFGTEHQKREYMQLKSIYWDFDGPILMKEVGLKFQWSSMKIIDHISAETITDMLKNNITLEDRLMKVKEKTGINSFVAVVNHMPRLNSLKLGDRHIYNIKYIIELL